MRYLATRRDVRAWRNNRGVARFDGRVVSFGINGQADISGIVMGGRRLEIETKHTTKPSEDQLNFAAMIRRFGGLYILARSVEDVAKGLPDELRGGP